MEWLCFPPGPNEETENIRLGAIIADPFKPNQVLTTADNSILNAFYPPVNETVQSNRFFLWFVDPAAPSFLKRCWEHLSSGMAVLSASSEKFTRYQLEAKVLITREFDDDPRQREIMARLANPTVNQYMDAPIPALLGLWSRENPVYMITGLKFAKGRSVFREAKIKTTEIRFRQNIASPIIRTDRVPSSSSAQELESGAETLVAYKLLKIERNHKRKDDSGNEIILSEVVVQGYERW